MAAASAVGRSPTSIEVWIGASPLRPDIRLIEDRARNRIEVERELETPALGWRPDRGRAPAGWPRRARDPGRRHGTAGRHAPKGLGRVTGRLASHRRQAFDQRAELVLTKEPDDRLPVVIGQARRLQVELDRQVADDRGQTATHQDLLAMLGELVAQLVRLDLIESLVQCVQAAKFADELRRGLLPHPGYARDVVGRIALERLVVDHLAGDQLEPLVDLRRVVQDGVLDARAGRHQAGVVRHQLEHVQIAGHDRGVQATSFGLHGDRPDDVVCLVPSQLVDRDPEGLDHLANLGKLVPQVIRHPLTSGLVLRVLLVAEGGALEVEGDRHVVRLEVGDPAQDDAAEAKDGIDELPREVVRGGSAK